MGSKRAMFVWLPNFAMALARLKQPQFAAPREPLALLEKHGAIKRVAALDEPAIRAGIYLHQPLADALAVYPKLICADAEPDAVEGALAALAAWAQRYSPATAASPPGGLWLDITGCAHLWAGEEKLAEDLIARLEARGVPARAAIAPTFGAAYALAHHARPYFIAPPNSVIPRPRPGIGIGRRPCRVSRIPRPEPVTSSMPKPKVHEPLRFIAVTAQLGWESHSRRPARGPPPRLPHSRRRRQSLPGGLLS